MSMDEMPRYAMRGMYLLLLASMFMILSPAGACGQGTGAVEGTVTAHESGSPLQGVTVIVKGTHLDATTNRLGYYLLADTPPGEYILVFRLVGRETLEFKVTVSARTTQRADVSLQERTILVEDFIVTATRESQSRNEIPASISSVGPNEIRALKPAHPSEIMRLIPGVWVNVTGGEGHMAAIRQPLTTNPVYLYLEDGVPTRSTGFFNHNALYEINLPQADRIEVIKGPGTSLYGSDAIGGIVNVLSKPPSFSNDAAALVEAGSFGWRRALLSGNIASGESRLRGNLNLTRTSGWRDGTDYDRQSMSARWDYNVGPRSLLKTLVSYSNIDQNTAGSSAISLSDYQNIPTINYTPISFRKVRALRVSSAFESEMGNVSLRVTPFFRYNQMDMLPNWSLTYDPAISYTKNNSFGLLAAVRFDLPGLDSRVIAGIDIDHSPGTHVEQRVVPLRMGKVFASYTPGSTLYDYEVRFQEASPYVHFESAPLTDLHLTGGMRMDFVNYRYDNNISSVDTGNVRRPSSMKVSYGHVSPKLGLTYSLLANLNVFVSYTHGFRVPSEGQLFRQGSAANTVGLKPVKVESYEAGLRGNINSTFTYDISAYTMTKRDDILTYNNPATGLTEAVNAGRTLHRGVEVGIGWLLFDGLRIDAAYSRSKHTYEEWVVSGIGAGTRYNGKEIETAPEDIGNARISYKAERWGADVGIAHIGRYWMDPADTREYRGHTLVQGGVSVTPVASIEIYARVVNLLDTRFAELASYTTARGEEYAPGMPRTVTAGISYTLQ